MDVTRRSIIVIIFLFLAGACHMMAQSSHLSGRISLQLRSVPLETALEEVAKAGNFSLSYNSDLLGPPRKVSLTVSGQKVETVFHDLLGDTIKAREIGDHIVLVRHVPRAPKEDNLVFTITGLVQAKDPERPLKEVTVYQAGTRRSSLSRADGKYSLVLQSRDGRVGICFLKHGYYDTVLFVDPAVAARPVNITMRVRSPEIDRIQVLPGQVSVQVAQPPVRASLDSLVVVDALVPRKSRINAINLHIFNTWPVQVTLFPPAGTNGRLSGSITTAFSLNLLVGYNGGVRGCEIGGFLNIDKHQVSGCQLGGFGNIVGGKVRGLQAGGFFNVDMSQVSGCQLGGFFNMAIDTFQGAQIGGLVNYLGGKWRGAQIGGLANVSVERVDGLQLAGLLNVTGGQVLGAQISGLINYAGVLKGFQLAPFNVVGRYESGVPVGLVSFVRKGYHCVEFSADEIMYGNIAFKTGIRQFYNIFKVGVGQDYMVSFTYGAGTLLRLGKRVSFNLDLTSGFLYGTKVPLTYYGAVLKFLAAVEYRVAKHFAVFAGPAYNLLFYSDAGERDYPAGIPFYSFYDQYHSGTREQMWVGGMIGIRL